MAVNTSSPSPAAQMSLLDTSESLHLLDEYIRKFDRGMEMPTIPGHIYTRDSHVLLSMETGLMWPEPQPFWDIRKIVDALDKSLSPTLLTAYKKRDAKQLTKAMVHQSREGFVCGSWRGPVNGKLIFKECEPFMYDPLMGMISNWFTRAAAEGKDPSFWTLLITAKIWCSSGGFEVPGEPLSKLPSVMLMKLTRHFLYQHWLPVLLVAHCKTDHKFVALSAKPQVH